MGDLMTIGEFSDRSGLSPKRLRTYAAEGLLAPAAVDPGSGYRFYAPGQLLVARLIDALRQAGIPLADIDDFLRRPTRAQLDEWADKLTADSKLREQALEVARSLLNNGVGATSRLQEKNTRQEVSTMTTLRVAGRSVTGSVRPNNQDAIVATDRLVMVADGMGGAPAGDVAANAAAGAVKAAFRGRSGEELEAAVRAANWAIWDRALSDPEFEGMGTTICAVGALDDGCLALVNVGDSRAYLWQDETLTQLTRDHSLTAELVERGELREEDARTHHQYGILTRALGVGPSVDIDTTILTVEVGQRLLLCTDGLFNEVPIAELTNLMAGAEDLSATVDSLIEKALEAGSRDNVSVVLAERAA